MTPRTAEAAQVEQANQAFYDAVERSDLDALEDVFGVQRRGLVHSRNVLRRYGNMSAATVLFVLAESLAAGGDGRRLLTALGPGFTAGFLLLEGS